MNLKPTFLILVLLISSCSQQRYGHREKVKVRPSAKVESKPDGREVVSLEIINPKITLPSFPSSSAEPLEFLSKPDTATESENTADLEATAPLQVADSLTTQEPVESSDPIGLNDLSLINILVIICLTILAVILGVVLAAIPVLMIFLFTWELSSLLALLLLILSLGFAVFINHWFIKIYLGKRLKFLAVLLLTAIVLSLFIGLGPHLPNSVQSIIGMLAIIGLIALIYSYINK